jgi:hypothetical protein
MPAPKDGMMMTGPKCDPIAQDCADPAQKCVLSFAGGMVTGACVTAGTVAEGATCMRGMMGMPDNCAKGLTCVRTGGGGGGTYAGAFLGRSAADA